MLILYVQQHDVQYNLHYGPIMSYMGYPEDSRLKANGEEDCGRQQYVLGRLYVQNIEVLS